MHNLAKCLICLPKSKLMSTHPVLFPGVGQWPLQSQDTGRLLQQEIVKSIVGRIHQAVAWHILGMS